MIEGDELVYGVTAGSLAPFASMRIARAGSISGLCLEEDRIMYCRDAEVDDRVDVETCQRIGARSMVAVPLRHHDTALGVVKVVSPLPHAFTDSDIETLELLASLMAAGVAHAEAYERVAEANARLVELDRLKDGFVATVSHELRTPLASIIAYTEMLTDGDAGALSSPQEQMVGAVERNSRRLHGLIEDLLTISKIEAGGFKTSLAPTELGPLVRAAGEALRHTAEAASLELRVDVAEDVGTVPADATQIDRALMNVLANAIKFSSPGGAIDLTARRVAEHIEIEVADEGIGIAAEDQERLFERFFRAASAKARAIPGSGLGLAIVKEIVEGHGGRVSIQSALGAGTRVTLRLPAQADASDEADDGQIANTLAV
jgi:signal transduction histidine kinase